MRVSPQHRIALTSWRAHLMFMSMDVLVSAKSLVEGGLASIDVNADEVDYVHILFDRHELVDVEGLWSESFFPGDTAMAAMSNTAREEIFELFPSLSRSLDSYGASVLPVLKTYECKMLWREFIGFSGQKVGRARQDA